jgi:type I restriction enzyme M protein
VPNGIVATTQNAYVKLRRFLVEDSLVAVVSLPAGVFKPYSGVKTSILLLDKKLARHTRQILFLRITADGFDLGDQRREIEANDLPEAEHIVKNWFKEQSPEKTGTKLAWNVTPRTELLVHRAVSLSVENGGESVSVDSEHKVVPLGQVCSILNGFAFKSEEYVENQEGLRIIRIANVQKGQIVDQAPKFYAPEQAAEFARYSLSEGDLLLSLTGNVGRVGRIPRAMLPALLNQRVAKVIPNTAQIDPAYLFHLLNEDRFEQEACRSATGAAQQNLSTRWIETYEIPLPSLEEQRQIVAEIEGYQKVLDGARQILVGYRAKISERQEWPVMELREFIEGKPKNGYSGKPVQHPTKIRVLTLTATTSGKMDITKFKYLDEDIPKEAPCRCRAGDIYLQRGNTKELVGTAAFLDVDVPDLVYPDLMIRVRANETKILTKFLLHTLQRQPVREYLMRSAGGAAGSMPKINQGIVESIPIPLPPLEEQRRIVAELDAEAVQMDTVRSLIPRFEAKIQRVLDRVWGSGTGATA